MNDNELSSMVRESVADIRSSTPVDQIISRGHAVRAWRRRVPAAAGALVVAGGAALGVTALAPSGHPAPTVSFSGHPDRVCQPYKNASPNLNRSLHGSLASNGSYFFTIHPLLVPSGVGLSITVEKIKGLPGPAVALRLVYASRQCTG